MKIAVWKTGHEIADRVALALAEGFDGIKSEQFGSNVCDVRYEQALSASNRRPISIAYGILRGTSQVFDHSDEWFNVDRGYFNPGHFDGYYRISYKGTQAKWHDDIPQQDIDFELEDWTKNKNGKTLICPPTSEVCKFFDVSETSWFVNNSWPNSIVRYKGDKSPINWDEISFVCTFNSSIGWQALQRGIPCISDPQHSIVGSYYTHELSKLSLDYTLENVMKIDREPLFRTMRAHQFTLAEIRDGKAWPLLQHYLNNRP